MSGEWDVKSENDRKILKGMQKMTFFNFDESRLFFRDTVR